MLAPVYNVDGIDVQFQTKFKEIAFGAIQSLALWLKGGTYLLVGTAQGQIQLRHVELDTGNVKNLISVRYF